MMGGDHPAHLLLTLPWPEPKEALDAIRKNHPSLKVTFMHLEHPNPWFSGYNIPDELWADITILATLVVLPRDPKLAPKLGLPTALTPRKFTKYAELVQFFMAGTNHFESHPIFKSSDIPLANASGVHGPCIAEWTVMNVLAASHKYRMLLDWQHQQKWGGQQGQSLEMLANVRDKVGQRLGVLGYGSIGRQVARVAKAMGMDVVAYTASPRNTPESRKDAGYIVPGTGDPNGELPSKWFSGLDKESLHEFLAQDLDVLLISVPLTRQTLHFLGEKEFSILGRRNAFVVNISRGQIIQQDALIAALEEFERSKGASGLQGAALDVTEPEPLPEGHPLWTAPNCTVTPHISGQSVAYGDRAMHILEINLDRWEKGEKFINQVSRVKGYAAFE